MSLILLGFLFWLAIH